MNNTFNARRFGLLFRKTLLERPVQLTGLTGLVLVIILIGYFICKSQISFNAAQNITFIWGLAGGGCFLASFVFGYFSSNASGSSYLTLPASHFEKWLCGILIAGILYPLIFLLFYRAMDAGFVAMYHNSLDPDSPLYKFQYKAVYLFSFKGIIASHVYPVALLLSGITLLGSLYFNKTGFIKTAIWFCAICLVIFGLNWLIATILFGNIEAAAPFRDVVMLVGKEVGSVELPKKIFQFMADCVDYILPTIFFVLAYIRLREKEF